MNKRTTTVGISIILALLGCLFAAPATQANIINEENQIYVIRPIITEPAWTQTGFYFNSMGFDLPNAVSRPSAQVGFVFTPGITWSIMDFIELNIAFPFVVNPDATGDRELEAADRARKLDSSYQDPPYWDSTPDLDFPGLSLGLKAAVIGNKKTDRFFLAVGISGSIPVVNSDKWSTNLMGPKTMPGHSNAFRLAPYVSLAYSLGQFSPQLQLGTFFRFNEEFYDVDHPPAAGDPLAKSDYFDFFFNLALPFAFLYEHTAPVLEINGVIGTESTQVFITPAVTFLPTNSPALISFACQIPVLDDEFRGIEGVRFMVNFSYRLDALSIPALASDEEDAEGSDDQPPSGW